MLELVHEYAPDVRELRLAEPGWPPMHVPDHVVTSVGECGIGATLEEARVKHDA